MPGAEAREKRDHAEGERETMQHVFASCPDTSWLSGHRNNPRPYFKNTEGFYRTTRIIPLYRDGPYHSRSIASPADRSPRM